MSLGTIIWLSCLTLGLFYLQIELVTIVKAMTKSLDTVAALIERLSN